MFNSLKLEPFVTPPIQGLLRPDWLVSASQNLSLPLTPAHSAPPIPRIVVAHPPPLMMPTPEEIAAAAAAADLAAARSRRQKGTSNIGIDHFKTGVDDFDEWVDLFESAVNLATKAPTVAEKHAEYWEWLKLRLDKPARAILTQAKAKVNDVAQAENRSATWPELKDALTLLLVDPHEKQKWHMKYMTVKWDGIESLHVFASRVISSVNKFDKKFDEAYRIREYFLRFRMGLPKNPYRDAIDMNVSFEDGTIDKAMIIALRTQMTQANAGENQYKQVSFDSAPSPASYGNVMVSDQYVAVSTPGGASAPPPKLYGNASMQDSRTSSLETSLAGINTQLENMSVDFRSYGSRIGTLEKDVESIKRSSSSSQGQYPNPWPPQNQGQWFYPNYWPPQGGYTTPFRPPSPHRSQSPHRSNQQFRSQSPRSSQQTRPPSPHQSNQQYQQQYQQQPQYSGQQYRSPNRAGQQGRSPSPHSSQRGRSPNNSGQQRYFPSPGKAHPSNTHPKYQQPPKSNEQYRAIDTGDEASGYETEVDPDVEVARLHEQLEKAKAKAKAKRGGN